MAARTRSRQVCQNVYCQLNELAMLIFGDEPVVAPKRERKHAHKCGDCRHIWKHADSNAGNEAAHMCPSCGAGPWWFKFFGRGSKS